MTTEDERFEEAMRRREAWQRERLAFPRPGDKPGIVATAYLEAASTASVIWNPTGSGRLRMVQPMPVRRHPPLRRGGIDLLDRYLVIDDEPLLQWRKSDCPSCEQLARAAWVQPAEVECATRQLESLTSEVVLRDPEACVDALGWLFALLPPGFYLMALRAYEPIVSVPRREGEGGLPYETQTRFDAREYRDDRPHRLVPTQRLGVVRADAAERARYTHATHPGIALQFHHRYAALLDGHHRALAASAERGEFQCITLIKGWSTYPTRWRGGRGVRQTTPRVMFHETETVLYPSDLPKTLHPWIEHCHDVVGGARQWEWDSALVDRWEVGFDRVQDE